MDESKQYHILALDALHQLKEGVTTSQVRPVWSSMGVNEKELFAIALFEEGKSLIMSGQDFAFNVFDLVRRIAPLSAKLHFKQGVFLYDYGVHKSGEKYLLLAQKHIQQAIKLKGRSVDAWYIWGDILVHLGLMKEDMSYFQLAHEKYNEAYQISKDKPKYLKKFLWDWALCWYFLGRHSGEAIDIKNAIERFEKAASLGCVQENFWRDFGNAYAAMGLLISDARFLNKALTCYQKAIQIKPTYFKGWLSSANAFQKLYEMTRKDEYLAQGHTSYGKAAELQRDNLELWVNWGNLFLISGNAKDETKHLQMAILKFEKALEINPRSEFALSSLAEAHAYLGNATSNLESLKIADKKISEALRFKNDDPIHLYRKGICIYMQGQYFDDESYYQEALDWYSKSLEIEPKNFKTLFALGQVNLALGNHQQDEEYYIEAHKYFRKASEVFSENPELWNQWGMTHLRLAELLDDHENIVQAVSKFEKSLSYFSNTSPPALLLFNYGCALDFLGSYSDDPKDYEKAAEVLGVLLRLYPHFGCVYYNLALVYTHLAEMISDVDYYGKALEAYHKAAQEDPEDPLIWSGWAIALMQYAMLIDDPLKQEFFTALVEEADKKLRKSIALGHLESYYHLACLYSMKGNLQDALHFLQIAHSKGSLPDQEELNYDPRLELLRGYNPYHEFIQSSPSKESFEEN